MPQNGTEEKGGCRGRRSSSVWSITGALWTAKFLNSKHFHRGGRESCMNTSRTQRSEKPGPLLV